jgi:hypothetical protein
LIGMTRFSAIDATQFVTSNDGIFGFAPIVFDYPSRWLR